MKDDWEAEHSHKRNLLGFGADPDHFVWKLPNWAPTSPSAFLVFTDVIIMDSTKDQYELQNYLHIFLLHQKHPVLDLNS